MPINRVVVNASPLICLFKSGLADLLPALFKKVNVPEEVRQEILAKGKGDFAAQGLPSTDWLKRVGGQIRRIVVGGGKGNSIPGTGRRTSGRPHRRKVPRPDRAQAFLFPFNGLPGREIQKLIALIYPVRRLNSIWDGMRKTKELVGTDE